MARMIRAPILICVLFLAQACGPPSVEKVAQALNDLAHATGIAQQTCIDLHSQELITDDQVRTYLLAFEKVNLAQKQAISITRKYAQLDNPTTQQLISLISPIAASVKELVDNGTIGIKDEKIRQQVLAVLLSVQTAVNTVDLILRQ